MLKSFKQYFEDQQMMMFSTKPVELYHGSNTGADNSTLRSFKSHGILPSVAQGWGQGAGFYVWSDKNSAIQHTKAIKDDTIQTKSKQDGLPMIVTVEAIPSPEKWDLDYEANRRILVNWLYENSDKFNQILSGEDVGITWKGERDILQGDSDQLVKAKGITVKMGTGRKALYDKDEAGTRSGEYFSAIVNRLQKKDPQTVHRFEELFFANMKPGVAIKYVGSEPLIPKRIEIFQDGKWIEV